MRSLTTFSLAAFVVAFPCVSHAATYYVGPNGSAAAAGTSRAEPTTSVAVAERLAPGDTVIFLDGVYTQGEETLLTKSGTQAAPITFRADDGATPVIRGKGLDPDKGAIGADADIGWYIFEGLWFENWGSGGIELDWDSKGCHDITIRHSVADYNGRNGFSPYNSKNATIEYNIASRNGRREESWSSNINIWASEGTIVARGNVTFHGVDTSSGKTDGNGFIADLTLGNANVLFENNIGFGNGGACIAVTDSSNAKLVGNTCYNNGHWGTHGEINLVDTCRGDVDGINVQMRGWTFNGASLTNNALIPTSGRQSVRTVPCGGGGANYTNMNNVTSGGADVFEDASAANFRPKAGSALTDKVAHGTTFGTDIGFDPKCIKLETDNTKKFKDYWTHAPDLEYVKSIGGIKNCFSPRMRPQGSNQEIGAYEVATSGCTTAKSCADQDPCTLDSCGADGMCVRTPIANCGGAGGPGTGGAPSGGSGGGGAPSGGSSTGGAPSGTAGAAPSAGAGAAAPSGGAPAAGGSAGASTSGGGVGVAGTSSSGAGAPSTSAGAGGGTGTPGAAGSAGSGAPTGGPSSGSGDDGGCSLSAGTSTGGASGLLALLGLTAFGAQRRSRSRRRKD